MGIFSGHESVNREPGSGGDTDRPSSMAYIGGYTVSEQKFFAGPQGIKSGDQGNFRPDQGILLSSATLALAPCRQIRSFRQISNVAEVRIPFSSTGEGQTRPDPAFCPAHLRFRYCAYGSMTYSNQFCLNEQKNSIFPLSI